MILTLRALRTNYDLDAKTVAEANGITYQTLLKYENDSSNIPVSLLKSLSKYYKVPMDNIFLGKKIRIKSNNRKRIERDKMKKIKKLKEFFEWNLDGYDVALAIIGSLIGVFLGTLVFWILFKK